VGESLRDDQRQALPDASAPVLLKMDNVKVGDTGPVSLSCVPVRWWRSPVCVAPVRKRLDVYCLPAGRRKVDKSP
jgi:hypothetical protein